MPSIQPMHNHWTKLFPSKTPAAEGIAAAETRRAAERIFSVLQEKFALGTAHLSGVASRN